MCRPEQSRRAPQTAPAGSSRARVRLSAHVVPTDGPMQSCEISGPMQCSAHSTARLVCCSAARPKANPESPSLSGTCKESTVHSEWSHALALRCAVALQPPNGALCVLRRLCAMRCMHACSVPRWSRLRVFCVADATCCCYVLQAAREHSRAAAFGPHPITDTHAQCSAVQCSAVQCSVV